MARLACVFLVFVLAYQCADVVNGDVKEEDLPSFVGNKGEFLGRLKRLCKKSYNTWDIFAVDLSDCRVSCSMMEFGGVYSQLHLINREPCSNDGGICVQGICAYTS
ncbi:uncharacterized protein LOC115314071 [Ixodes scapularis]|uniref:uncharacterized protein LOC115314071 n=1 Tax=Ixodes scapularis TaxID=6945 RepID=UPI001A9F9349|nr:uncharacterized protein LOC115314071 [Ixodes scapularis]XP_040069569.1 uncharacterized protein LOC115314071 [Ixodes scapularis]